MTQLNEAAADLLDPAQAADLARILELQAQWENHRDDPARRGCTTSDLQDRQKAYGTYRSRVADYAARYRAVEIPEQPLNTPERLAAWCRLVRAVFRRAEGAADKPDQVVAKLHRLTDRIATRLKADAVERGPHPENVAAAVGEFDAVVRWCDGLIGAGGPVGRKLAAAA